MVQRGQFLIALLSMSMAACSLLVDSPDATYDTGGNQHLPPRWSVGPGSDFITATTWLTAPTNEPSDNFGTALTLRDDELLVVAATGEPQMPSDAAENCGEIIDAEDAGRIYAFDRNRLGHSWNATGELRREQARADRGIVSFVTGELFLESRSRAGAIPPRSAFPQPTTTVVTAAWIPRSQTPEKCILFTRAADGLWSPSTVLTSSSPDTADYFGATVALTDDELFVGAIGDDGRQRRSLRVQTRWERTGARSSASKPSHPQANAFFGNALSIDGDALAVGAWLESSWGERHPRSHGSIGQLAFRA